MPLKDKCFSPLHVIPSLIVLKSLGSTSLRRSHYQEENAQTRTRTSREGKHLVTVHLRLVWTCNLESEVIGLDWGELSELGVDVCQMKLGNGLVEDLWENVDTDGEFLGLAKLDVLLSESLVLRLEKEDLSKDLVGE